MIEENLIELTERIEALELRFLGFEEEEIGNNEYENFKLEVYLIERDVAELFGLVDKSHIAELKKIQVKIAQIKKNNDFEEEEAELDRLYPNRHEADFDPESISYASVLRDR